ncbi:MAG TPA: PAS domain-containing sensor histidine kinase [Burkholderiales bacterium]|nr:PAS domain-containing sensor histidine kinase [Burkholderiales bacterium]
MRPPRLIAAKLQQLVDRIDPQAGRYRMLFETSPLPMWVVDDETLGFLAVNDAAVRLYGYSREEFLAMRADGFLPPARAGNVFRGAFRHPRKNGEPLDVDAVGHLVGWRGRPARLVVINDISERLRAQAALRALSRRLLEIQEEERGRLARDLHDDIGQALTALKIQVESLRGALGDAAQRERVAQRVEDCVDTIQSTLERVRQLSLSLRPPQLDDLGLAAALRSHLDRQARVAGLASHFDATGAPHDVSPETETACFRVAQEAITNVLRHARARNLWVRLYDDAGRLALSVRDDGAGFDVRAVRGLGLAGMEERTALVGGSLELRASPGKGTVVLAKFPLAAAESEQFA